MPGEEDDDRFNDEHDASQQGPGGPHAPPARQHKYSTADMKPERPWKRWCLTLLTCLVCIAIMILITILMQKLFDPPEDEGWDDDKVNATDDYVQGTPGALSGAAATLPKNMEYIEDVCDETRVGRDDVAACEAACEPAKDCCNPFGNGNSTCFEQEQAGCFAYSKCHSLNGFFDPAHTQLDRICSIAEIELDPTECIEACRSLSCCYIKEDSCVAKHFEACLDYAPCQNIMKDTIDVAPDDLDETCENPSPTCKRACDEAAECCGNPNSKCYREDFVACMSYSSCTGKSDLTITVAPIYSRMEPAPGTLEDDCSEKGIADNGVDHCLEACAPAQCCWEDGASGCFGDDPLGCLEYERCTILKYPDYSFYTFPPTTPAPGAGSGAAGAGAGAAPESSPTGDTEAPAESPTGNETEATQAPSATASQSSGRKIRG